MFYNPVSFLMDERIDKGTGTTIGSTHDDLSVRTDLNCNGFPLTVDNFVRNGKTILIVPPVCND